ncbi:MAG: murein biosynthesis integral membrane protein MurJ [Rhodospirillaceae bacterium]|nr:murein biosynthesis integral membrane protein MurJ [Rhodospirillaceae bacterium]OUT77371.1 MAG: murein biosynthesis integral membrane protein MurJ [Rhodospirillaceae bacterium TMED23]|tara:strand:+ start:36631 stop:38178 length:1548 start_codon:yes stop_codon:yes gene_type:complete
MALFKSIFTISALTLVSRLFGFIRDVLIAIFLGTGILADIFFVAFKIPNLFRRLFAEGALSAAFVPQFLSLNNKSGFEHAIRFAQEVLSILVLVTLGFVVLMQMFMPIVILLFAPGFLQSKEKLDLAIVLTRITFPYLIFISLVSLMSGVLNALGKFAAAAATPILLNVALIGSLILLSEHTQTPAHALAWGVSVGGLMQFIWLLIYCSKLGVYLRLTLPKFSKEVMLMLKRIIPVAIGAGVYQVSLLIDTIIASFLPSGSISYLFYADRINQLPIGIVGVAIGTALLPTLSKSLIANNEKLALDTQNRAIEFSIVLALPAAIALIILAGPVISTLFERGQFGADSVVSTAAALSIYSIGLPAYILIKALVPGYFSRGDTSTPIKIAGFAIVINIIFNLILMGPFLHLGIAAATVISAWCNVALLSVFLWKRGQLKPDNLFLYRLPRAILATLIMGCLVYLGAFLFEESLNGKVFEKFITLIALVFLGLTSYGCITIYFKVYSLKDITGVFKQKI